MTHVLHVRSHHPLTSFSTPCKLHWRLERGCWCKPFSDCCTLTNECRLRKKKKVKRNHGDCARELRIVEELEHATNISEKTKEFCLGLSLDLKRSSLKSRRETDIYQDECKSTKRARRQKWSESMKERLLKEFSSLIWQEVLILPLTTPCALNF